MEYSNEKESMGFSKWQEASLSASKSGVSRVGVGRRVRPDSVSAAGSLDDMRKLAKYLRTEGYKVVLREPTLKYVVGETVGQYARVYRVKSFKSKKAALNWVAAQPLDKREAYRVDEVIEQAKVRLD